MLPSIELPRNAHVRDLEASARTLPSLVITSSWSISEALVIYQNRHESNYGEIKNYFVSISLSNRVLTLLPTHDKPFLFLLWRFDFSIYAPWYTCLPFPTSQTSCSQAIKNWEVKNETSAEDATVVKLYCQMPPIAKLDNSLNMLKNCEWVNARCRSHKSPGR